MKIEIQSTEVFTRTGTSSKTNQPYSIPEQTAYFHEEGKPYPTEMKITLEKGASAWAPGFYTVDPRSFYVDRYGRLTIGRLVLNKLPAKVAQAS